MEYTRIGSRSHNPAGASTSNATVKAASRQIPRASHNITGLSVILSKNRRLKRQVLEDDIKKRGELKIRAAVMHSHNGSEKSIDMFRNDPRDGGDSNRVDLAYAIYAFSHGVTEAEVAGAGCSSGHCAVQ